jgi:glycosyltransferase involved in cell wall biosynthesis
MMKERIFIGKEELMKILQAIPYFNPKFGGDFNVCTNLSKELAKDSHEVTIITTDFGFDSKSAEEIRSEGIYVIPFHCVANFGLFLYSPSTKPWLEKNLKEFDIIHLHIYRSYQNVPVHKFAMKFRIPYIVQAHGSILPFFEKQNLKKLYDFVWGYKILRNASKLIAVSNVEKDQYLKMGLPGKKIEIIPNGIDVSEYELLPQRGRFRKKYGIAPYEKIILYLGRLHKSKGIDFLINGFSSLLNQNYKLKLVIVGPDDGFFDALIKQTKKLKIEDNVVFLGSLYKEEKYEVLVDADVLVYPGIFEIFGLVPFEAIMCGTPVIVCDDCGCGEIIKKADCGYLVKFGDVNNLKEKMNFALENNEYNNKLVENGKRFIKENLTWKKVGKTVEDFYKNSIQNEKDE